MDFYIVSAICPMSMEAYESKVVKKILDQLLKYGEDHTCQYDTPLKDKSGQLHLSVSGYMSSSSPEKVDELMEDLGRHLAEATTVTYEYQGPPGEYVIGPSSKAIQRRERLNAIDKIAVQLDELVKLHVNRTKLAWVRRSLKELRESLK